jgi:hypothetical protein
MCKAVFVHKKHDGPDSSNLARAHASRALLQKEPTDGGQMCSLEAFMTRPHRRSRPQGRGFPDGLKRSPSAWCFFTYSSSARSSIFKDVTKASWSGPCFSTCTTARESRPLCAHARARMSATRGLATGRSLAAEDVDGSKRLRDEQDGELHRHPRQRAQCVGDQLAVVLPRVRFRLHRLQRVQALLREAGAFIAHRHGPPRATLASGVTRTDRVQCHEDR